MVEVCDRVAAAAVAFVVEGARHWEHWFRSHAALYLLIYNECGSAIMDEAGE